MTDNDWLLLNALVDNELDAAASFALEQRIAAEPGLAAAHTRLVAMRRAIERLEKPEVSQDFHARMAALASPTVSPLARHSRVRPRRSIEDWRAIAASLVFTACASSGATYILTASNVADQTEEAVISGHQRSLLSSNTVDIASSDRHTVRPWFDAKLGISPPAVDLANKGFPLVGGRVEVVDGKTVPTLVYSHGKHLVSVVAIPQDVANKTETSAVFSVVNGYNVAHWSHAGFSYWAISDLDAPKLEELVNELRSQ